MLDRESPLTLYYQIAIDMRQRIRRGEWTLSQKIPSEIDLAQEYNVSRMTLRQALGYLEKEGVLSRKRGLGTFVEKDSKNLSHSLNFPLSFTQQIRDLGYTISSKLISSEVVSEIESEMAILLELGENEEIAYFERIFFANEKPFALIKSMIPSNLCPGITEEVLLNNSLTTTLEKKYGLYPVQYDQWASVSNLTSKEADLLNVDHRTAGLGIKTISYDEDGKIIEYAKMLSIRDQFSLHIQVFPMGETNMTLVEYVVNSLD